MGSLTSFANLLLGVMIFASHNPQAQGLLYPRESETREVRSLDGMWNFVKGNTNDPKEGFKEEWFKYDLTRLSKPTLQMPVPSSYNDITEDPALRDHVGAVWYDRRFFTPQSWSKHQRVWIRFGSVHYMAVVWINGVEAVRHEIGHLPFEADITEHLYYGQENRVTVFCDNILLQDTIPQGTVVEEQTDKGMEKHQRYSFDFFNYAGIHRSVYLFTTPVVSISDIDIKTDIKENTGYITYQIETNPDAPNDTLSLDVKVFDRDGQVRGHDSVGNNLSGIVQIPQVEKWWPYLMSNTPGYLYTVEFLLKNKNQNVDVYRTKIGIRTIRWTNTTLLINEKPAYLRGFGKHEDSDIRGKGLDYPLLTKDFNLLRWIGANTYRTSHYPYSEESMQFADEFGIMIVDECPSVDTDNYSDALMAKHKQSITELIRRDKHHASVIMWSIANEPRTQRILASAYFKKIADHARRLDSTRPITAAIAVDRSQDGLAQWCDIIMFNRYNAWYSNTGYLDMVTQRVVDEATGWHEKHNKPVLMSEYGADTVEGLHILPAFVWSEEYQEEVFSKHFKAFDQLRKAGFFIGEFVWNFADFKTAQTYTRVGGNKKGVFTRNRQPKAVAYTLRRRYFSLAKELEGYPLPKDLAPYIHKDVTNNRVEL